MYTHLNPEYLGQATSTCGGHSTSAPHKLGDAYVDGLAGFVAHSITNEHAPSVLTPYGQSQNLRASNSKSTHHLAFDDHIPKNAPKQASPGIFVGAITRALDIESPPGLTGEVPRQDDEGDACALHCGDASMHDPHVPLPSAPRQRAGKSGRIRGRRHQCVAQRLRSPVAVHRVVGARACIRTAPLWPIAPSLATVVVELVLNMLIHQVRPHNKRK